VMAFTEPVKPDADDSTGISKLFYLWPILRLSCFIYFIQLMDSQRIGPF
jgi:hypothetical protein